MADYKKPLPKPDPQTAPYWESLKQHEMKIQRCNDTGKFFFYPRGLSPFTGTDDLSWESVSGNGTVYGFTIIPEAKRAYPGFGDDAPYVVAMVELEEGPKMMTNLVNVEADPEHVSVGMPVKLVYDDVTEEVTLPKFEPA